MKEFTTELTTSTDFAAAHRLLGYDGKCAYLHGHNWHVEVTYHFMALKCFPPSGILVDFGDIKSVVKQEFDHKVLLETGDPLVKVLKAADQQVATLAGNPTAENLSLLIAELMPSIVGHYYTLEVKVWESSVSCAVTRLCFDYR